MITLHYHPGNASFAPHVVLHELGVPFELQRVDRAAGQHKTPAYLRLNPNGQIPVLVDGDLAGGWRPRALRGSRHLPAPGGHPSASGPGAAAGQCGERPLLQVAGLDDQHDAGHADALLLRRSAGGSRPSRSSGPDQGACAGARGRVPAATRQSAGAPGWSMDAGQPLQRAGSLCLDAVPLDTRLRPAAGARVPRPARAYPHIAPFLQRMLERPAMQRTIASEQLVAPLF